MRESKLHRREEQQRKSLISSEKQNGPYYNSTFGSINSPGTLISGLYHWLKSTARGQIKREITEYGAWRLRWHIIDGDRGENSDMLKASGLRIQPL